MTVFEVIDVFHLKNGTTVFAGHYSSGAKVFGAYRLLVGGRDVGEVSIPEEMLFPSKTTTDIALCTFDKISPDAIDLSKGVVLTRAD